MDIFRLPKDKEDLSSPFLKHKNFEEIWNEYEKYEKQELKKLTSGEALNYIKSHLNFFDRKEEIIYTKEEIKMGDICYIDFGVNYKQECGYFHLGLILDIKQFKYLVLPMTSNPKTFEKAVFWNKENLIPLPRVENIKKNTTLFLNDAKFINSARIISKIASIGEESPELVHIKRIFNDYIGNVK